MHAAECHSAGEDGGWLQSIGREQQTLGLGSLASLIALVPVVVFYLQQPLMRGQEGQLLLGALLTGEVFNVVCIAGWLSPSGADTVPCVFQVCLRQFGLLASSFYFVALSVHLRHSILSPFSSLNTGILHFVAVSAAALFVTLVEAVFHGIADAVESGCPCPGLLLHASAQVVMPVMVLGYATAIVLVVRAWLQITRGVHNDGVFTRQRCVVTRALFRILCAEAVYVGLALLLLVAQPLLPQGRLSRDASLAFVAMLAFQDAHSSLVWVMNYLASARSLQTALVQDAEEAESEGQQGPSDAHGTTVSRYDSCEFSHSLRKQLVALIAQVNNESVRAMAAETAGLGAGSLHSAASSSQSQYSRVVTTVVQPPDQEHWPVEVRAYAPRVFHELRHLFRLDPDEFVESMSDRTHERFTEGKSGAFFYFTHDRRFIIKTARDAEFKFLLRMLPRYHEHVRSHPDTLINRLLGAYQLQLYGQRVQVIVVESVFQTSRPIDERYDLKGSWVRVASKGDRFARLSRWERGEAESRFQGIKTDMSLRGPLLLEPRDARLLGQALRWDTSFLAENGVMDYSLLLGICNTVFTVCGAPEGGVASQCGGAVGSRTPRLPSAGAEGVVPEGPFHRRHDGCLRAAVVEGPELYCMGLIDVLQEFTLRKRLEHIVRQYLLCGGPGISCQPPRVYARRFIENVVEPVIENGGASRAVAGNLRRPGSTIARPSLLRGSSAHLHVGLVEQEDGVELKHVQSLSPLGGPVGGFPSLAVSEARGP